MEQRRNGQGHLGQTWDAIYDQFSGIENTTLRSTETFPENGLNRNGSTNRRNGNAPNRVNHGQTTTMTQFPGNDLTVGSQDPVRQEVVR